MFQAGLLAGIDFPPSIAHDALRNVDAQFGGNGALLPSTVILDYLYGIAAYNAWHSNCSDSFNEMEAYRNQHYAQISPPPPPQPDDTDVTPRADDPNETDYISLQSRKYHTPTRRTGLEDAMDRLNMFLMYIHGITPEMAAERRQKEIEQEEQAEIK